MRKPAKRSARPAIRRRIHKPSMRTRSFPDRNILGRWKRVFSDGNDIQVQAYFDRADRRTPNYAEIRDTFDVDLLQRFRLPARQEISWGLGARLDPVYDPVVVSGLQFVPNRRYGLSGNRIRTGRNRARGSAPHS